MGCSFFSLSTWKICSQVDYNLKLLYLIRILSYKEIIYNFSIIIFFGGIRCGMDVVMDALIETRPMELLARCIQTKTGHERVTGDGFTVQNSPRE